MFPEVFITIQMTAMMNGMIRAGLNAKFPVRKAKSGTANGVILVIPDKTSGLKTPRRTDAAKPIQIPIRVE